MNEGTFLPKSKKNLLSQFAKVHQFMEIMLILYSFSKITSRTLTVDLNFFSDNHSSKQCSEDSNTGWLDTLIHQRWDFLNGPTDQMSSK